MGRSQNLVHPIYICLLIFISITFLLIGRLSCGDHEPLKPVVLDSVPPASHDPSAPTDLPFGINVWGAGLGESYGLVESTKGVIRSLEAAGIPFVVNDVEAFEQKLKNGQKWTAPPTAPYFFNLWSTSFMRALKNSKNFANFFIDRYNFALWYWELEKPPREAAPAYPIYDQVWVAGDYVARAFLNSEERSRVPVRQQCIALLLDNMENVSDAELKSIAEKDRPRFGLNPGDFVFYYNWDYDSLGERKNPQAVVNAFKLAFPRDQSGVALLLKTKPPRSFVYKDMHKQLEALAGNDSRIHIIAQVLPASDMEIIYKTVDSFVSLHRSEGFGNGIAYAMAMGKPVIATNYSAPVEYMNEVNAYPVRWNYTTITRKLYIFPVGSQWAEADVEHAAERMREVLVDPVKRRRKGFMARQTILSRYSPKVCGQAIKEELEFLYAHRNIINRYLVARYKKNA